MAVAGCRDGESPYEIARSSEGASMNIGLNLKLRLHDRPNRKKCSDAECARSSQPFTTFLPSTTRCQCVNMLHGRARMSGASVLARSNWMRSTTLKPWEEQKDAWCDGVIA